MKFKFLRTHQPFGDRRPLKDRMFVYSWNEFAAVAGIKRRALLSWRQKYPDVPEPPTTKTAIQGWMARFDLPNPMRRRLCFTHYEVVRLRKEGHSWGAISKLLTITRTTAQNHWISHLRRQAAMRRKHGTALAGYLDDAGDDRRPGWF